MDWLRRNRIWLTSVLAAALIALTGALTRKTEIPVRAETVKRESIVNTITTNGKVEPVDNFQAHALAASAVRKVWVKEGDHVKAGQMLVQLDDSDARAQAARAHAQIKAAEADLQAVRIGGTNEEVLTTQSNLVKTKAELDSAQRNLTAMQKLKESGSASAGEVEEADNRLKRAQAEYDLVQKRQSGRFSTPEVSRVAAQLAEARAAYAAAEDMLRKTNIAAPRAGTVYSAPVKDGAFLNPGDLIVQVADLSRMQVRAFVDEPDIAKLIKGQKAGLTWDALPGRNWEGTVSSVPTTVTLKGSRNVGEVIVSVNNSDRKLLPNVNVNVSIITSREDNVLVVSREAVNSEDGQRYVYVIQNGKLARTSIETGIASLTRVQVLKGPSEGSLVALGAVNSAPLADRASVKVAQH